MSTATATTKQIPEDVLDNLKLCSCDGQKLVITQQLDRKDYVKLNKVLESLGGKWNKAGKHHLFPEPAGTLIADVIAFGEYIDAGDRRKEIQFFETPRDLADVMAQMAGIHGLDGVMTVLEPSAGHGRLVSSALLNGANVVAVEFAEENATVLREQYEEAITDERLRVIEADFLQLESELGWYDAVIMNPPFTRSQDIKHVQHAFGFLKPGGTLVAVMSPGFTFRQDRKATEFREWLGEVEGEWEELPAGTFKESGTMVSTVLLKIEKQ